jgi:hypothetical protein
MADLTPVPAPRSPFAGWRGRMVSVVVIGILAAVVKPWGEGTPAEASPAPSASVTPALPVILEPIGRTYDPTTFGPDVPPAAWAIVTPGRRTALDFLDRADVPDASSAPSGGGGDADLPLADPADDAAETSAPAGSDADTGASIVSGPVVDLGTADDLDAIAITHPTGISVGTVRIWRFVDGVPPRRVTLDDLPPPWPVDHVTVIAQRQSGMDAQRVLPWAPGLYRLDLLVEPVGRARSVMLSVRPGSGGAPTGEDGVEPRRSGPAFGVASLRLLPDTANLWAAGAFLSGWRRDPVPPTCRVAEIWRATDPREACWPVPLGATDAVGVNLPTNDVADSIELIGIDPLPGPVAAQPHMTVEGRIGMAMIRAPVGGLADGIYRLDVRTVSGERLSWYLEVGPIGRAVAEYYGASVYR